MGGTNNGVGSHAKRTKATNRKYKIIENADNTYSVKIRTFFGYYFIRENWKPIVFETFAEVVTYVLKRRKKDAMSKM